MGRTRHHTRSGIRGPRDVTSCGSSFVRSLLVLLLTAFPARAGAQHQHGAAASPGAWRIGAHAVPVLTRVSPAMGGEPATEWYLTHPVLWAMRGGDRFCVHAMVNLEGLTLERGELTPGIWGEGYFDRRHPHTYLHELVGVVQHRAGPLAGSVAVGRGFAPFGTDDPMARPIARYAANHHLAQILERAIVVGAARWGAVGLEVGVFNGDEPETPASLPSLRRFGDSWSARATAYPSAGVELQTSYARVASPEHPAGSGLDHRKRSTSARYERGSLYLLAEFARTDEFNREVHLFTFRSALAEAAATARGVRVSARLERTHRPEEERSPASPFRTVRPHADAHLLGITRWDLATARVGGALEPVRFFGVEPFLEVTRARPTAMRVPTAWLPREVYGADVLYALSAGARVSLGGVHGRMGRYGAAVAAPQHH